MFISKFYHKVIVSQQIILYNISLFLKTLLPTYHRNDLDFIIKDQPKEMSYEHLLYILI